MGTVLLGSSRDDCAAFSYDGLTLLICGAPLSARTHNLKLVPCTAVMTRWKDGSCLGRIFRLHGPRVRRCDCVLRAIVHPRWN